MTNPISETKVSGTSTERGKIPASTALGMTFRETDTGISYFSDGVSWLTKSTSGADNVSDQAIHAVRNGSSATNSYDGTLRLANAIIVNKQTAVTVGGSAGANDTRLVAINIVKALTGTCVITGFVDDAGAAASITIPALALAGLYDFGGILNSAGTLTVTCSNAAEALNVIILWWPA